MMSFDLFWPCISSGITMLKQLLLRSMSEIKNKNNLGDIIHVVCHRDRELIYTRKWQTQCKGLDRQKDVDIIELHDELKINWIGYLFMLPKASLSGRFFVAVYFSQWPYLYKCNNIPINFSCTVQCPVQISKC